MQIIIEYIGISRKQALELARALSSAAEEVAENHPEIGFPDKITVKKDEEAYAY